MPHSKYTKLIYSKYKRITGLNYWQPQVSNDYQTWQPFGGNGMMSGSSSISSSSSSSSGSKSEASTQLRDGRKLSIIVEYDPVKKIEVVKQCIRSTCEPASEKDCIVVDVPKSSC